jgi:tRNA(adenine34) deaminase
VNAFIEAADRSMMKRCIELSRAAAIQGEYPHGAVIAFDGAIVAEAINRAIKESDVSRHAEIIALSVAQKALSKHQLARATLYTNVEPCAMCSFCIRESWIGRVVYALKCPVMGGSSKWNILHDREISSRIPIFGPAPELVSGVLSQEVEEVWRAWNPLAWEMMRLRNILTTARFPGEGPKISPGDGPTGWQRLVFAFMRLAHARSGRVKRNRLPAKERQSLEAANPRRPDGFE